MAIKKNRITNTSDSVGYIFYVCSFLRTQRVRNFCVCSSVFIVEVLRFHSVLVGLQIGTDIIENNIEIHQKTETEMPYIPAIPLLELSKKKKKR